MRRRIPLRLRLLVVGSYSLLDLCDFVRTTFRAVVPRVDRATAGRLMSGMPLADLPDVVVTLRQRSGSPVLRASFRVIHSELRGDIILLTGHEQPVGREDRSHGGRTVTLALRAKVLEDVGPPEDETSLRDRSRASEDRVLARHAL